MLTSILKNKQTKPTKNRHINRSCLKSHYAAGYQVRIKQKLRNREFTIFIRLTILNEYSFCEFEDESQMWWQFHCFSLKTKKIESDCISFLYVAVLYVFLIFLLAGSAYITEMRPAWNRISQTRKIFGLYLLHLQTLDLFSFFPRLQRILSLSLFPTYSYTRINCILIFW